MNRKLFLVVMLLITIQCVTGLFLECLFFVNSGDRIEEQKAIDPFVCCVLGEFDGLAVHQLYHDTLMFKIDEDFSLADMEAVVIRFEDYMDGRSDVDFVKRIKFLDQNVQDILIPRVGACAIEFVRWNDTEHFDTLNIYSIDSEKYPYLEDFSFYHSLTRRYNFNICIPMEFEDEDDTSVINTVFFSSGAEGVNRDVLIDHGVSIVEEGINRGF